MIKKYLFIKYGLVSKKHSPTELETLLRKFPLHLNNEECEYRSISNFIKLKQVLKLLTFTYFERIIFCDKHFTKHTTVIKQLIPSKNYTNDYIKTFQLRKTKYSFYSFDRFK